MGNTAHKHQNGFTLVEALIALTVLSAGLIPVFVMTSGAFRLARTTRSDTIATYLAQEGAELVQAIRDDNWFAGRSFNDGFSACSSGCRVQYNQVNFLPNADRPLSIDSNGMYQYDSGDASLFHRTITITPSGTGEKVLSRVTWQEGSEEKSFQLEYHLYDWLTP